MFVEFRTTLLFIDSCNSAVYFSAFSLNVCILFSPQCLKVPIGISGIFQVFGFKNAHIMSNTGRISSIRTRIQAFRNTIIIITAPINTASILNTISVAIDKISSISFMYEPYPPFQCVPAVRCNPHTPLISQECLFIALSQKLLFDLSDSTQILLFCPPLFLGCFLQNGFIRVIVAYLLENLLEFHRVLSHHSIKGVQECLCLIIENFLPFYSLQLCLIPVILNHFVNQWLRELFIRSVPPLQENQFPIVFFSDNFQINISYGRFQIVSLQNPSVVFSLHIFLNVSAFVFAQIRTTPEWVFQAQVLNTDPEQECLVPKSDTTGYIVRIQIMLQNRRENAHRVFTVAYNCRI